MGSQSAVDSHESPISCQFDSRPSSAVSRPSANGKLLTPHPDLLHPLFTLADRKPHPRSNKLLQEPRVCPRPRFGATVNGTSSASAPLTMAERSAQPPGTPRPGNEAVRV